MCELISTDTKEWAYSVFSRISDEEFSRELMIIVLFRSIRIIWLGKIRPYTALS